ncbi:MAG: tetratricopeptide repeat protein [Chloroflexota bacterium]|nr:tetratricopeptide repeat protein [Chloroflexota bacterium]
MTLRMEGGHAVLVFALLCALPLAACGGGASSRTPSSAPSATAEATPDASSKADQQIAFLQARVARDPLDYPDLNALAIAYLQRARETGDVSELTRADNALARSLAIRPDDNYDALALSASLDITRHDFARGVDLARKAIVLKAKEAYGYGALGDGLMGIGEYDQAADAYALDLQLDPGLSSYGRQALVDMNTGKRDDAERMWNMTVDAAAGDGVPEHAGWAHSQLANFYFITGDLARARAQYQQSLDVFPNYVHALAGLGRVAAAGGDYKTAAGFYTEAIDRVPLPEYVSALGDVYAASGGEKKASDQFALIAAIEQLYNANGVNLDIQVGLFNADHDRNLADTVVRAKAAYAQQPSIQAADMLAWVQYKAGDIGAARDAIGLALRTNTFDPLVLFHAGMIANDAGDAAAAKSYLSRVAAQAPYFSVLYSARVAAQLAALGGQ